MEVRRVEQILSGIVATGCGSQTSLEPIVPDVPDLPQLDEA
jgi:hypothetical protein